MKKQMTEIAKTELKGVFGLTQFVEYGIDELISYLYEDEEILDEFEFEQNVLYYFDCDNEIERNKIAVASQKMYEVYSK